MRRVILSVAAAVATAVLVGCSEAPGSVGISADGVPSFEGPWAAALAQAWLDSATDEQRAILSDGLVSDAEYAESRQGLVECLAGFGATATMGPYGTMSIEPGGLTDTELNDRILPDCEGQTVGEVAFLYEQMARNPQNRDEAELMVECLQDADVVGPAYTVGQWLVDSETQTGLDWADPRIRDCGLDPLGILSGG